MLNRIIKEVEEEVEAEAEDVVEEADLKQKKHQPKELKEKMNNF